jgi:hypothetical protein
MNHENGKEKASFSKAGKNCADITLLDDTLVFSTAGALVVVTV